MVTPKDSANTCAAGAWRLIVIFFLWLCHACGVSAPWLGIGPMLPAVESRLPGHWTIREVPRIHLQELWCTSVDHVVGCFSGKRHHKQNHISRGRHSFKLPARSLSWDPSSLWRSLAFLGEAWSADVTVASQILWLVYSPGCRWPQHTWPPWAAIPGRSTAAPQLLLQALVYCTSAHEISCPRHLCGYNHSAALLISVYHFYCLSSRVGKREINTLCQSFGYLPN